MWLRKCGQGRRFVVPKGLMIVARQFIAWKGVQTGIRPVGHGLIPYPGLINRAKRAAPIGPNHTVPSGTVPVFAPIPGNKLPGYFHNVPTGQRHLTPVCEIEATSPPLRAAGFEDDDEDSLSDVAFCAHLVGSSVASEVGRTKRLMAVQTVAQSIVPG
jgi:hypothetical protein